MDKNKSEKLKEILNQTLSTEEIEKKLKEEIRNNALKKEKITKEDKQEPLKEDVIIPSIREKEKEVRGMNILLYLVIIIAILLFSIVIYLFTNNKKVDYNTNTETTKEKKLNTSSLEENLILINNDKKENKDKILILDKKTEKKVNLKTNEKIDEKLTSISSKNKEKPLEIKVAQEEVKEIVKPKEVIKIKEVIKEKIVTKTIRLDKKNFKEYYNSSKYNSLKCYNFKAGDIFPTSQCKSDLKKFLISNKNAIRFEVIPIIGENDNIIFKKMESNLKNMDKKFQSKVKEYMSKGLARERVLETSWNIKHQLGEDTILTPTNYYVKSKKDNKGIIIKAYH